MISNSINFQIGKSGINENVISSLKNTFKNYKNVRVSVLKSSGRDKDSIKVMAEEIKNKIGFPIAYKIIGFTIILMKRKG